MASLDRLSPVPLYYQLEQALLQRIRSGELSRGDALPSEKELEEQYGVSQITVRRALQELAADGHISRQAGRGTFVLEPSIQRSAEGLGHIREYLHVRGFRPSCKLLHNSMVRAPEEVARQLGVGEDQLVLHLGKLIYADEEPFLLVDGYHNLGGAIAFTTEELVSDSLFLLLEQKYGMSLHGAERTIGAKASSPEEAALLCVPVNAPLLVAELLVYNRQDQCLSFVRSMYRGDRYKYHQTIDLAGQRL